MLQLATLREAVLEQEKQRAAQQGMPRNALGSLPQVPGFATIVKGVRRCGKSWLLNQWLARQSAPTVAVHFDDLRLWGFSAGDFPLLDMLLAEKNAAIVVLDEIQEIDGWERYVSALLEQRKTVLATGSSARMLSAELGTKLTGRHLDQELFPFAYDEFLRFTAQPSGVSSLDDYLTTGGFPAYVAARQPQILTELLNDLLYRDVIVRYGIKNASSVRLLAGYLLNHIGCRLAPSRLKDAIHVSAANTVLEYLDHFRECYLLRMLPRFAESSKGRMLSQKKIYACDTGLLSVVQTPSGENAGHKLENLIFVHLFRRAGELSYYLHDQDDTECDFLQEQPDGRVTAVQVCWELNAENSEREIRGLRHAMERFSLPEAFLVTHAQSDTVLTAGRKINVIPAYTFLQNC